MASSRNRIRIRLDELAPDKYDLRLARPLVTNAARPFPCDQVGPPPELHYSVVVKKRDAPSSGQGGFRIKCLAPRFFPASSMALTIWPPARDLIGTQQALWRYDFPIERLQLHND